MNQNMLKNNKILKAQMGDKIATEEDGIFSTRNNRMSPIMYMHVDRVQSPREWILDPEFASDSYFTPEMTVTGKGARNYQIALNRVSNFKLREYPRTQQDYQRDMYFGKFKPSEVDRLVYLNNALDAAWNNERLKYQNGDISNAKFNRMQKRYNEQKNIINENLRNINKAADKLAYNAQFMNELNDLGNAWGAGFTGTMLGVPTISALGAAAVAGAPYVAEAIPTIAKGIAKGMLDPRTLVAIAGGEATNEGVKLLSDGKYKSVGDMVNKESGLSNLTKGTWAEDPARMVSEMVNPGYWVNYRSVANSLGNYIDDGILKAKNLGLFTRSEGVPSNALYMGLPWSPKRKLTLEGVNQKANEKRINISGEPPTDNELGLINKYVKNQPTRQGEPVRQVYKQDGQWKYNYGIGTQDHLLDLNNIPSSNTGVWNWIKEHKWPLIFGGSSILTGLGPYIVGIASRNVANADDYFNKGFNPEQSKTPEQNIQPQEELPEADVAYRAVVDSLYNKRNNNQLPW